MAERDVAVRAHGVVHLGKGNAGESRRDEVVVEEPLELRLAGDTIAVTMRTPGNDRELALGFLLSEGVIASLADVGSVAHCGIVGEPGYGNVIDVRPGPGVALAAPGELARRGTLITAACGVCGRASIDDLLARCVPLPGPRPIARRVLVEAVAALARNQPHFERTGGLHAALVVNAQCHVLAAAEDVGRHNAVDKVVGALLLAGARSVNSSADRQAAVLAVTGRVSFEIVQKAVVAKIGAVCGISAPTSLAIELAERCGVTLAAFVREHSLNLYAHPEAVLDGGA